jgi:hypothetical protein
VLVASIVVYSCAAPAPEGRESTENTSRVFSLALSLPIVSARALDSRRNTLQ